VPLNAQSALGHPARSRPDRATPLAISIVLALLNLGACTKKLLPPKPYLAFVANHDSNTVAVVNLATLRLVRSLSVPPGPAQEAARPSAEELYVLSDSGSVTIIGEADLQTKGVVAVGAGAANLTMADDGSRAAVTNAAGEVAVINCQTRTVEGRATIGSDLSGLVFSPDGKTLIAADRAGDRLVFVDAPTAKALVEVHVGKSPGPMIVLPDGSKLFVADTGESKITAVDLASRQVLANLELGSNPVGLILKPDGGELIALSRDSATLSIVDTFHDDVEEDRPISTGKSPVGGVATRDSTKVYILNGGPEGGSVQGIDLTTRMPIGTTYIGGSPAAIALTPDERFLAVADAGSSFLTILGCSPLSPRPKVPGTPIPLITTIPVGAEPVAIVIPGLLQ
jgi:YVTN family beta-propeller protein